MKNIYIALSLFFCLLLSSYQSTARQSQVDSLMTALTNSEPDTNRVLTYARLVISLRRDNPEEATKLVNEGIMLSKKLNYSFGEGELLFWKAVMLGTEQKYSESNQTYKLSEELFEKSGRVTGRVFQIYGQMSRNMGAIGHKAEALEFDMKRLVLSDKQNNIAQKRAAAASISRDYEQLQDYDNELEYQLMAFNLCRNDSNCTKANYSTILNNIGSAYKNMNMFDESISHLHQSLKINTELGNENTKAYNYATLGDVYYLMNKYDSSEYYINLLMEKAKVLESGLLISYAFNDRGRLRLGQGKYNKAVEDLEKAYKMAADGNFEEVLVLSIRNLHEAYKFKGDYYNAFNYLEKDLKYQKELYEDYLAKAGEIQNYYSSEQEQTELELHKRQEAILEAENHRQEIFLWVSVIGTVLLLILLLLFYRNFRNKQKANKILNARNKEIQKSNKEIANQKEKLEQAFQNIKLLSEIGQEVTTHLSISKIIETTYNSVNSLMKAEAFGIGIYNEEKNRIDFPGFIEKGITYPNSSDLLDNDNRLSVWCFKNQQEVIINDTITDYSKYIKRRLAPNIGESPESILYFPLVNQGKKIGVITVQSFDKNAYDEYHLDMLRTLAIYIAIALENAENFKKLKSASEESEKQKELIEQRGLALASQTEKIEKAYENVKLLGQIGQGIISKLSVNDIVATVYQSVHELMDASVFWVGIYNEEANELEFTGAIENGEVLEPFSIKCNDPNRLAVYCHENQKDIRIGDFLRDYSEYVPMLKPAVAGEQPASIIYLPLKGKDGRLGVITVQSFKKYVYTEYHENILRNLATYTTIALENAILYQEMEDKVKKRTSQLASQKDKIEQAFENIKKLSEIGQKLTGLLSLDSLIKAIYENVNGLMDATAFSVGVYEEGADRIAFIGSVEKGEELPTFYHDVDETRYMSAWCFKNNKEIFTNNAHQEYVDYVPNMQTPEEGLFPGSIIYIPLRAKNRNIGVLTVQSYKENAYTEYHLNILRNLAIYSAIAVDNAYAYEKIELINTEVQMSNKKIMSSMNYAKRIQNAILPHRSAIEDAFEDSFVLFKPKDIVSGDFFWFSERGNKKFIAAVDCTGHGVPGAFMSMIGNNLLSEIVNDLDIESPDKILTELHKRVRLALRQQETENRDGMDMALCVIDEDAGTLEFAGAKNPLLFIGYDDDGKVMLNTIKGDKMPIGGMQREAERIFSKHTLQIREENIVLAGGNENGNYEVKKMPLPKTFYIFSDGYQDQFGGRKSRKFMMKNFRRLLERIHDQPMAKQRDTLKEIIEMWMEGEQQTDDILVIGFRVKS